MDFESIEYVAIYGGMPQAAAQLNLRGDGDATVRFDGNGDSPSRNSPLFPKQGPAKRAGRISAEQRQAIGAALAGANISESVGLQATVGPIASGRATIVRGGRSISVEFPLYEPTARFQPLRDALDAAIASLLAAP